MKAGVCQEKDSRAMLPLAGTAGKWSMWLVSGAVGLR